MVCALSLAALVIKHFENLKLLMLPLQSLDFHVPTFATGELVASGSMEKPPRPRPLQSVCPVVFEIFAGSGVTSALAQGWTCCCGVDKTCPYLVGLWFAPPCGTSSRARAIPLHDATGRPVPAPKPLRDDTRPDGLPALSGVQLDRVCVANILYQLTADLCLWASERGLLVPVENPSNSLFWKTSMWRSAAAACPLTTHFQHCAFGGNRPKWTRLSHNHTTFSALARTCPGSSRHSAESFFLACGLVCCSSLEHLVKLVVLGKLHCLFCRRLCKLRLAA